MRAANQNSVEALYGLVELYQSLTWDRGKELTDHRRYTLATKIDVCFCDPQSRWQRGSNENTIGLLSLPLRNASSDRHGPSSKRAVLAAIRDFIDGCPYRAVTGALSHRRSILLNVNVEKPQSSRPKLQTVSAPIYL